MRKIRIAIIGAGPVTEWALAPALLSPDMLAPPDSGAWWTRRPVADSEIRYQPPAVPDLVALADADAPRVARVAAAARIPAVYGDWRAMLREVGPDAVLCADTPELFQAVLAAAPAAGVRTVWCDGPPAQTSAAVLQLAAGHGTRVWCARPLRQAAAHRAARQAIARGEIGRVAALALRWNTPFAAAPKSGVSREAGAAWVAAYSACDLLLAFAPSVETAPAAGVTAATASGTMSPLTVVAAARDEATSVWLRCANGVVVTALMAGADSWNAPLPRLEICGDEGRAIVCEAGRRMWLHAPREAARLFEPPGLGMYITATNVAGVAEEMKAFLAACANPPADVGAANESAFMEAARVLQLMEGIAESLPGGRAVNIPAPGAARDVARPEPSAALAPATLPLLLE